MQPEVEREGAMGGAGGGGRIPTGLRQKLVGHAPLFQVPGGMSAALHQTRLEVKPLRP